ncbi:hypothetical protein GE061_015536 [Apolygus lucorum]|uniref:Uncharacterized protein n=1 Tax=Apolygus lucorum TaxID=248454 RepID=A0A8S9XP17_APOLU|nr:hypothetical protein GE061_015536 [Apolygus lucorum]
MPKKKHAAFVYAARHFRNLVILSSAADKTRSSNVYNFCSFHLSDLHNYSRMSVSETSRCASPLMESRVSREFHQARVLGVSRLEIMRKLGILPESLTSSCIKSTLNKFEEYSNMRSTEEKLLRLEVIEKIANFNPAEHQFEKKIALLTAMYLEQGRRLSDEEFTEEIEMAVKLHKEEEERRMMTENSSDSKKPEESTQVLPSSPGSSLVPKLKRLPVYLLDGYQDGLDLIIEGNTITLLSKFKRKTTSSKKFPKVDKSRRI